MGTLVENRRPLALLLIGVAIFTTLSSSARGERCYLYIDQREGDPYDPDHSVCAEFLQLLTKHCPEPRDLMCEEHRTDDLPELGGIPWKTLKPADHLELVEAIVRSAWLFESAQEAGWRKKKTKVLREIRNGTLQLRVAKLDIDRDGRTDVIVELQHGRCFSKDYEKQIVVTDDHMKSVDTGATRATNMSGVTKMFSYRGSPFFLNWVGAEGSLWIRRAYSSGDGSGRFVPMTTCEYAFKKTKPGEP